MNNSSFNPTFGKLIKVRGLTKAERFFPPSQSKMAKCPVCKKSGNKATIEDQGECLRCVHVRADTLDENTYE